MNVWHVYPENDLRPHRTDGMDCECNPRIKTESGFNVVYQKTLDAIIIHNSFDGREAVEEANRILGND